MGNSLWRAEGTDVSRRRSGRRPIKWLSKAGKLRELSGVEFNGTIAEEREVLAACLGHLYLGERQVVRSLTRSGAHMPGGEEAVTSYLRENLDLEPETLEDFIVKNREQHPVDPDLNPGGGLICLNDEEFRRMFRDGDGWDRFRRAFPESDGTLRFSRIGLNRSVTQAVLYAGQQFDWSIGSGGYWLFSKFGGAWLETGRTGVWIS